MTTAPPTPPDTDAVAYVAALRRLKAWSGLSYRRLERRAADAGHCLPYSTAATMLGRERLPRAELVAAFVAACGIRGVEAQAWLDARTGIACGPVPADVPPTNTPPPVAVPSRVRRGRRRWALVGAAALVTALLGGATASGVFTDDEEVLRTPTSVRL
ncbi:hypothetical protein ACH4Y0_19590 [Streptomyces sp. NPDC020707]|jgi:hypothetical protein|uniref:XRE family transcriptional regulator n=1 Tax=Streptomyces ortus TaxID=2867268 RepID=A0ABT3VFI1_9ACTN|nr:MULTISPECIES: hypothetical protein [Streptomyces]MCX4238704.1 hypothetical protein [Streptomyces ortus]